MAMWITFINYLPWILFGGLALQDLRTRTIPVITLTLFEAAILLRCFFVPQGRMMWIVETIEMVALGGASFPFANSMRMGWGDWWILLGLPFLLMPDQLTMALIYGLWHAGITSLIVVGMGLPQKKIPLLPFLYWGCLYVVLGG